MRIYSPKIRLSENEKKLLQLMAKLILEDNNYLNSNISADLIALSDEEAEELLRLLQLLLEKKEFWQASSFIDHVTNMPSETSDRLARNMFIYGLENKKKQAIMASYRWFEFLKRLGIGEVKKISISPSSQKIRPMEYEHFLTMEKMLFDRALIPASVSLPIIEQIKERKNEVMAIKKPMENTGLSIIKTIKTRIDKGEDKTVVKMDLCSAITLIVNYSVMFTTRDWGVTGTLSCLAAIHMSLFTNK